VLPDKGHVAVAVVVKAIKQGVRDRCFVEVQKTSLYHHFMASLLGAPSLPPPLLIAACQGDTPVVLRPSQADSGCCSPHPGALGAKASRRPQSPGPRAGSLRLPQTQRLVLGRSNLKCGMAILVAGTLLLLQRGAADDPGCGAGFTICPGSPDAFCDPVPCSNRYLWVTQDPVITGGTQVAMYVRKATSRSR
jgi:hypothetical protein